MAFVVARACIGTKDHGCVDVCPVDCFYEGDDQVFIHPDECIDCGACVPECPVSAIFAEDDVPDDQRDFIKKNADAFADGAPKLPVAQKHDEWERDKTVPGTIAHEYYKRYPPKDGGAS